LPDVLMQEIAAENNLSETAFLVREGEGWGLRWFTPTVEMDLCGHATLASAFILARDLPHQREFLFRTRSGELRVTREGERFTLDFPVREVHKLPPRAAVAAALGAEVLTLASAANVCIAELADARTVRGLRPDFNLLRSLEFRAVNVTARGDNCDFVSRFFGPKVGINEDPVTGSAHCGLVPFWVPRLGKSVLTAQQVSPRGGELLCELRGQRVFMTGSATLYSSGTLHLP
jgi:PhzF family phenazine biosynthesis protein